MLRGILLLLAVLLIAPNARAQTNVVINCQTGTTASGQAIVAPASAANPCPVMDAGGSAPAPYARTPVATHQQLTLSGSAQSLTVPPGATIIDFVGEGTAGTNNNCLRYTDDGVAPAATVGFPLQPGQAYTNYTGSLANLKFINATGATCTLDVDFYK